MTNKVAFYAGGLMPGSQNVHIFYFVIANAMLKLYILVLYMSQSFYGLNGGTHRSAPVPPPGVGTDELAIHYVIVMPKFTILQGTLG
jgi:hypothetical protein